MLYRWGERQVNTCHPSETRLENEHTAIEAKKKVTAESETAVISARMKTPIRCPNVSRTLVGDISVKGER